MAEVAPYSHPRSEADREALVARGKRLEYFTIAWNAIEAVVALASGIVAGSVALVGFGLDSVIETVSAAVLLWRLSIDHDVTRREAVERRAHRLVGICFLVLAAYVALEALRDLWTGERAGRSIPGILIAVASVVVMPVLARAKRRIGAELGSRAMRSDSRQTDFCAYLSAILLVGLALQYTLGWWWADPVAALIMVPIIVHEGMQGLHGHVCDDCHPQAN